MLRMLLVLLTTRAFFLARASAGMNKAAITNTMSSRMPPVSSASRRLTGSPRSERLLQVRSSQARAFLHGRLGRDTAGTCRAAADG